MALTFENINFKDTFHPKFKVLYRTFIFDEGNFNNEEIWLQLEIEEKDAKPFLDYFRSMSNK